MKGLCSKRSPPVPYSHIHSQKSHRLVATKKYISGLSQQLATSLQTTCSCTKTGTRQVKASEYWLIDNKLQQGCLQIQLVRFWPVYMHGASNNWPMLLRLFSHNVKEPGYKAATMFECVMLCLYYIHLWQS